MNDRFTEKARNAIEKARAAAMELGHSYIGTEHLLLGIVRETDALGSRVLRENGADATLMSGSGPTVYGLFSDRNTADAAATVLARRFSETFLTETVQ